MNKLTVMGKVSYKHIVTSEYKAKAILDIDRQLSDIDGEISNFDKQMNKTITELTLKAHPQIDLLRQQFNAEREKILVYRKQIEETKIQIEELKEGERVSSGEGNFVTELHVGDVFNETLNYEVVIENGIVIEINKSV